MSQAQGPLLAWAAACLGVEEMPEPLSREGVVASLGQGVAWDSPGVPAPGLRNIHLSKPLCLTFHIVEAGLPWSHVCLCVHPLYVFAGHGSLCQREMLPVLGWRWGGGHEWVGFSALQEGDGLSLGALASETHSLVSL